MAYNHSATRMRGSIGVRPGCPSTALICLSNGSMSNVSVNSQTVRAAWSLGSNSSRLRGFGSTCDRSGELTHGGRAAPSLRASCESIVVCRVSGPGSPYQ